MRHNLSSARKSLGGAADAAAADAAAVDAAGEAAGAAAAAAAAGAAVCPGAAVAGVRLSLVLDGTSGGGSGRTALGPSSLLQ